MNCEQSHTTQSSVEARLVSSCLGYRGECKLSYRHTCVISSLCTCLLMLSTEQPQYTHRLSTVNGVWRGNMPDKPYVECSGCGCQKLTTSPTRRLRSGRASENYNWHKVHIGINTQNVLNNYVVVNFINCLLFPQFLINLVLQNQFFIFYDHSQWQAPHRLTRIKILPK